MSPSGAVSGLASSSLAALAWLVALLCVPLGGAFAAPPPAAATPMVMVDAFEYALGDTLTVRGSGLEPGADYVVALTSPTGETSETTVAASGAGSLSVSAPLDEPGAWTVALSGPRVAALPRPLPSVQELGRMAGEAIASDPRQEAYVRGLVEGLRRSM